MIFILLFSFEALAQVDSSNLFLSVDTSFSQSLFSQSSRNQTTSSYYGASAFARVGATSHFIIGVDYFQMTNKEQTSTTEISDLKTSYLLVGAKYLIGRKENFFLSAHFGPNFSNYSQSGAANETWSGTSGAFSVGLQPKLTQNLRAGFSIIYISSVYTTDSTTNKISSSRTQLFPKISLTLNF